MKKQKLIGLAALTLTLQGTAFADDLERSIGLEDSLSHSLHYVEKFKEVSPSAAGKSMTDSFIGNGVDFEVAVESTTIKKIRSREDLSQLPGAPVHKVKVEEKQSFGHQAKTLLVSSVKSFVTAVTSFVKKLGILFSI